MTRGRGLNLHFWHPPRDMKGCARLVTAVCPFWSRAFYWRLFYMIFRKLETKVVEIVELRHLSTLVTTCNTLPCIYKIILIVIFKTIFQKIPTALIFKLNNHVEFEQQTSWSIFSFHYHILNLNWTLKNPDFSLLFASQNVWKLHILTPLFYRTS